jgi:hypothetical protein
VRLPIGAREVWSWYYLHEKALTRSGPRLGAGRKDKTGALPPRHPAVIRV